MEYSKDTRIIDLTLGEFEDWFKANCIPHTASQRQERKFVYGYSGIIGLFHCSESKAYRLRKGMLKEAVLQDTEGGAIMIDVEKALELYGKKNVTH